LRRSSEPIDGGVLARAARDHVPAVGRSGVTMMKRSSRRARNPYAAYAFIAPLALAMGACFLAPLLDSAVTSLHPFTDAGVDEGRWSLENYAALASPFYFHVATRSLRISLEICAVTILLAYPTALYISGTRGGVKAFLLALFVVPWLVNVSVKAAGWILLLSPNGPMNTLLLSLGLIGKPVEILFTETAIIIGLVHSHLLFLVLPLVAALDGMDKDVVPAAANLGARPWSVFWRITLPQTAPALAAGLLLNFAFNISAFATPALLGGARVPLLTQIAFDINLVQLNWPLGSALAISLLLLTMALVILARQLTRRPAPATEYGL
jgi:putative spermidine/putrescine transport system permease protein